jgi:hypothetical protein
VTQDTGPVTATPVPEPAVPAFVTRAAAGSVDPEHGVELWYGVFNDPRDLEAKFATGELDAGLREVLLDNPIYETRNLPDAVRHLVLTQEDRRRAYEEQVLAARARGPLFARSGDGEYSVARGGTAFTVPPPAGLVLRWQRVTRTNWVTVSPADVRALVEPPSAPQVVDTRRSRR